MAKFRTFEEAEKYASKRFEENSEWLENQKLKLENAIKENDSKLSNEIMKEIKEKGFGGMVLYNSDNTLREVSIDVNFRRVKGGWELAC